MKGLWIVCLWSILSTVSASPRTRIYRQANDNSINLSESDLETLLANAFGGLNTTTSSPTSGSVNTNSRPVVPVPPRGPVSTEGTGVGIEDDDCECVPYYLCNTNRTIIENGEGLIDIRLKGECDYLEVCCSTSQTLPPDQPITLSPPPLEPTPTPYEPIPSPFEPIPSPYEPIPSPYEPIPSPYKPIPSPYEPIPSPYEPIPSPYETTPAPYERTPSPPRPMADVCGKRNQEGVSTLRISGAENGEAQFGEFPWMVAIIRKELVNEQQTLNVYQCGGSLISSNVVLTAAHCVQGKTGLIVRAGEWDTQRTNEPLPTQNRAVRHMVIHEGYYAGALYNDVALLFLESPVDTRSPNVGTICLPEQNENMDNRLCVATGWGKDVFGREGKYQVILKKVDLPTVPRDKCLQALRETRLGARFKLHSSFLCAGGKKGQDTCMGDGGGPLVCPSSTDPNVYVQTGIVSWGIGCGTETPGVYVDVAKFRDWIDSQLSIHNIDPKRLNT